MRRFLLAIGLPILITHAAYSFVGCAHLAQGLKDVDEVNDPSDDAKLAACRKLGREAKADGASPADAYALYYDCTEDAGLR
jgi:hypothetical protein